MALFETPPQLPPARGRGRPSVLDNLSVEQIATVLRECDGHITPAAQRLGCAPSTIDNLAASHPEIAAALRPSMRQKKMIRGTGNPLPFTGIELAALISQHGGSVDAAATELGCTPAAIHYHAKKDDIVAAAVRQRCLRCRVEKPLTDFPRFGRKHGRLTRTRDTLCAPCRQQKDEEDALADSPIPPNVSRYGLSPLEYRRIAAHAQDNLCAICKQPETYRNRTGNICPLAVDHDHATGKIRGLICQKCNTALGSFRDDPAILRAAAHYLRTTSAVP